MTLFEQQATHDPAATNRLVTQLYADLQAIARAMMKSERGHHTLQATAVVNEAYLRLIKRCTPLPCSTRAEFMRLASRELRRVLIDHARHRSRQRRGGSQQRLPLDQITIICRDDQIDLLALDEALTRLGELDPQKVEIVEMRYFAGLNNTEIAHALDIPLRTVERKWSLARSRLYLLMRDGTDGHANA